MTYNFFRLIFFFIAQEEIINMGQNVGPSIASALVQRQRSAFHACRRLWWAFDSVSHSILLLLTLNHRFSFVTHTQLHISQFSKSQALSHVDFFFFPRKKCGFFSFLLFSTRFPGYFHFLVSLSGLFSKKTNKKNTNAWEAEWGF